MKQFIIHLNDQKIADKKFIIEDLDATHLLIKGDVRDEITRKVEEWMDEVSHIMILVCCIQFDFFSLFMLHILFGANNILHCNQERLLHN